MSQTININNSPHAQTWRNRMVQRYGMNVPIQQLMTIPNWLTGKSMAFFFVAMAMCWMLFGYVPAMNLIIVASISVVLFFGLGRALSNNWLHTSEKRFLRNTFTTGFFIRLIWVLYMYFLFNPEHYGTTYGDRADVDWFMSFARDLADWIVGDTYYTLAQVIEVNDSAIDDVGYPMWLAVEYLLTGGLDYVFIPMIVKCVVSAYCAICIYRIAKRHFGIGTARIAAIFVCLNPNMIYWCASMMKETEMVFVCCLAVDKMDEALSSGNKLTLRTLWPGILLGLYLFFLRTALGLAFFGGVMMHILLASNKVINSSTKIVASILITIMLLISVGDRVMRQTNMYFEMVQSGAQESNMEWRSGKTGNSFAKYASSVVFAPLIFTIPFPTMNEANAIQYTQMQLAGGSYIKNVLSAFVLYILFVLLLSGKWRNHVFILAYTCAYLVILVFSSFAQSGRFHMPIWPMLMLLAAYGIQYVRQNTRIRNMYIYVLIAEVFVCIAWNWFKLAGRGLI